MDTQPRELNSQPHGLSVVRRPFPSAPAKTTALTPLVFKKRVHVQGIRKNGRLVSQKTLPFLIIPSLQAERVRVRSVLPFYSRHISHGAFVSPPDHRTTISGFFETIALTNIPAMQTSICFNSPKPIFPKTERKILVVPVEKY